MSLESTAEPHPASHPDLINLDEHHAAKSQLARSVLLPVHEQVPDMSNHHRPMENRALWIEACRRKMLQADPRISHEDVTELAEALWNRTSVRAHRAIASVLQVTSGRRPFSLPRHER